MVATPKVLVGFAALALAAINGVDAAPTQANPTTIYSGKLLMNEMNPAYAAVQRRGRLGVAIKNVKPHLGRKLEEHEVKNDDITRVEDHLGPLERDLKVLTEKYSFKEYGSQPWPSSYWPMFRDGINHRWSDDELSASEKYAKAFGKDVDEVTKEVSKKAGVLSQVDNGASECTTDEECVGREGDYVACGKRRGESKGLCIPKWFGICHAWAPAAILEEEPQCTVTKNGVDFTIMDIKGLLTQVYDDTDLHTIFTGARHDGASDESAVDQFGRFTDPARRDLGPGYFHLVTTNMLGKHGKSFVIDTSPDAPVWNQPIRGYNVKSVEYLSLAEGAKLVKDSLSSYVFNDKAVKTAKVATEVSWIFERETNEAWVGVHIDDATHTQTYEYVLELDENNHIIGGEWINESKTNHPDFLWFPVGKPSDGAVTKSGISYADVKDLLEKARQCDGKTEAPTAAPTPVAAGSPVPTASRNGTNGTAGSHNGKHNQQQQQQKQVKVTSHDFLPKASVVGQKAPGKPIEVEYVEVSPVAVTPSPFTKPSPKADNKPSSPKTDNKPSSPKADTKPSSPKADQKPADTKAAEAPAPGKVHGKGDAPAPAKNAC
ncbi:TPA: hypothetical protein N0F65_009544 [Lagenidium giganteum]|uniref:Elicitor-like transglutaminase n=1 Tax=Lagenidium giganteum TaxID=4803 RepID=A0AAV2YWM9_9STRA|nr:TPA: hypothetical protein N0F65_009544 [Lagenidium giganteum]